MECFIDNSRLFNCFPQVGNVDTLCDKNPIKFYHYINDSSLMIVLHLVLFLLCPPNCVRKLLCNLWTLNFVMSSQSNKVDLSRFLADKVYKFSSRKTNYKFLH